MSAPIPRAFMDWPYLRCGLCGQAVTAPEAGDDLHDLIRLVRAHQRSEVCEP